MKIKKTPKTGTGRKSIAKDAVRDAACLISYLEHTVPKKKGQDCQQSTFFAETKSEGNKIYAFMTGELEKEMHKAVEAIVAHANHCKRLIKNNDTSRLPRSRAR